MTDETVKENSTEQTKQSSPERKSKVKGRGKNSSQSKSSRTSLAPTHRKITQASDLLSAEGIPLQTGWSTSPILTYNRDLIAAPWYRIKEWEYYGVTEKHYSLNLFVADLGYAALVGLVYHDFLLGNAETWGGVKLLPRGKLGLTTDPNYGDFTVSNWMSGTVRIKKNGDRHYVSIDAPKFNSLKAELTFHVDPHEDAMVVSTGYSDLPSHFYYNYKKNMLATEGYIEFNQQKQILSPEKSIGNFDWGRGVWPRQCEWYWATGAGRIGKDKVWFNLGYGFGNLQHHSENMLFVNGKVHKLDRVKFHLSPKHSGEPWQFTSNDGRINLTLEPKTDISNRANIGFAGVDASQIHGRYSGTIILDNGRVLQISSLCGHAEKLKFKW